MNEWMMKKTPSISDRVHVTGEKRIAGIRQVCGNILTRSTPRRWNSSDDGAVGLGGGPAHGSKCRAVDAEW